MKTENGFIINSEAFNNAQDYMLMFMENFEVDFDTMIEVFEMVNDRLNGEEL